MRAHRRRRAISATSCLILASAALAAGCPALAPYGLGPTAQNANQPGPGEPLLEQPAQGEPAPGQAGQGGAAAEPSRRELRERVPASKGPAASGRACRVDHEGWLVKSPSRWDYVEKDGRAVFSSYTEAGFILVWFAPGATFQDMESGTDARLQQLGLTQTGKPRAQRMKGGRALIVELSGVGADGVAIRGRAIGVAGAGGAVVVLGLTSMSFERTLVLCPDGRFFDSSQSDISVTATDKNPWNPHGDTTTGSGRNSQGGGNGRWRAVGDDLRGTLELHSLDGQVQTYSYVFKRRGGGDIELDGRWYGRDPSRYQGCE